MLYWYKSTNTDARDAGVAEGLAYCFLRCCEREEQLFMHVSEVMELANADVC